MSPFPKKLLHLLWIAPAAAFATGVTLIGAAVLLVFVVGVLWWAIGVSARGISAQAAQARVRQRERLHLEAQERKAADRRRASAREEERREEQQTKEQRQQEEKRQAEAVEKVAAKAEAERYYDEHADALRDVFPRAAFNTWLRLYMAADVAAKERWDALRELISRLQPLVAQGGERRQRADKRVRRRQRQLREIDKNIAECEEALARLTGAGLEPDMAAGEESRLRRQLRRLHQERRELDPNP